MFETAHAAASPKLYMARDGFVGSPASSGMMPAVASAVALPDAAGVPAARLRAYSSGVRALPSSRRADTMVSCRNGRTTTTVRAAC